MESGQPTFTFAELLVATGMTQGQAITALHQLGRDMFTEGLSSATFTEVEVQILRENSSPVGPATKKRDRPRRRKHANAPRVDSSNDDSPDTVRNIPAIAEYYGLDLDTVLDACDELEIRPPKKNGDLPARRAERLHNHLALQIHARDNEDDNEEDDDDTRSTFTIGDLPTVIVPPQRPATPQTSVPQHVLLERLAQSLEITVDDVQRVMAVVGLPVPAGPRPKVTLAQSERIASAVALRRSLPSDRLDRDEVRIRPVFDHHNISLEIGQEFCVQRRITLTHGKYCSTDDGLRLLLLLEDSSTVDLLRRRSASSPTVGVPTEVVEDAPEAANFEGVDLSRQDFLGVSFAGANLRGADLSFCNLSEADFSGADLTGANLTRTTCAKTKFISATCAGVTFENAVLNLADFSGADLTGATLTPRTMRRANFSGANLTDGHITIPDDEYVILDGTTWTDGNVVNKVSDLGTRS